MTEHLVYVPPTFQPMPKMPRLQKQVVVTEKIDGTNAQVHIEEFTPTPGSEFIITEDMLVVKVWEDGRHWLVRAGSKNRYLTRENDNFGFAKWVIDNGAELLNLGLGVHRGEWWGKGIQRGYGLEEKRFSLFNVSRWHDTHGDVQPLIDTRPDGSTTQSSPAPKCCHVVPVLGLGDGFEGLGEGLVMLRDLGSQAAPGFAKPEGIVAFHTGSGLAFKMTIENDIGKWAESVPQEQEGLKAVANG